MLTLNEWAKRHSILKTTLHHRVVTVGMSMADAVALGRGKRGKPLTRSADCRTGAATEEDEVEDEVDSVDGDTDDPEPDPPELLAGDMVPRDGIEPPTRGFSIPCSTN